MDINKVLKYILYVLVALLGMWMINTWHHDFPPPVQQDSVSSSVDATNFVPQPLAAPTEQNSGATLAIPRSPSFNASAEQGFIRVHTDLYTIEIDPIGGNIVSATLTKYPISVQQKNTPIQILNPNPNQIYIADAGLVNAGSQSVRYHADATNYTMNADQDTLAITLKGQLQNGLRVEKTYTFMRGEYATKLDFTVENRAHDTWAGGFYHQIVRKNIPVAHPYLQRSSYDGAAISTPDVPYQQWPFKKMSEQNISQTVTGGWVAMQQPYFVSSWIPQEKSVNEFYSHKDDSNSVFTLGYVGTRVILAPGKSATTSSTFYVGPELADQLAKVSPALTKTIDYGWLAPISVLIFWLMQKIFLVVGNWGWTIILITLLIKAIFYPLSNKSYKSMAKMRIAQPRIKALQERFADDKPALNKAVMEFYKNEKLNPMGGCLPMIIQIPVFFALYYVLIESVELRQAPWILWIQDLSTKDPYFILPILMGISMFVQQKLSPPPPDPTQAKVMMVMPILFTFMFLWFPAGLVLYWLTNNVLSILHQYYSLRTYDPKKEQHIARDSDREKKQKKKK